jgi:hypothetical protein
VKATDFGLTEETQLCLYRNGVAAGEQFLRYWSFDQYLAQHHRRLPAVEAS